MRSGILRGHLDALILATIESGPMHGYAIADALEERSHGTVDLPTGTLYPALRRLEDLGYLESSWSSANGRKRRIYHLTQSGSAALSADRQAWTEFSGVIGAILDSKKSPS